jgi:hypothetical protein
MQVTNMQELPINDFLHDDMLLKVTYSNLWYANIVNYMVSGYVPPGKIGENCKSKVDVTFGMIRICIGSVQMAC